MLVPNRIIDLELNIYLSFYKMTNSHFGHDRDGNCINDLFDHFGIALISLKLECET